MTREVAIKAIQDFIGWFKEDSLIRKALDMAIKALSQEPCEKCVYSTKNGYCQYDDVTETIPPLEPCDDAISREAVLDIVCGNYEKDGFGESNFYKAIEQLPSITQKSGKWIPVSEPPKELGTYLIQTDGEPYMCQCRWTDVNPFWTDLKTKPHWNIFDLPQYSKVVAWMPLPEPYEPQESEEQKNETDN